MEERQVEDFVYRVLRNEQLRQELIANPEVVITREDFTPRVALVVSRLVPYLSLFRVSNSLQGNPWWFF